MSLNVTLPILANGRLPDILFAAVLAVHHINTNNFSLVSGISDYNLNIDPVFVDTYGTTLDSVRAFFCGADQTPLVIGPDEEVEAVLGKLVDVRGVLSMTWEPLQAPINPSSMCRTHPISSLASAYVSILRIWNWKRFAYLSRSSTYQQDMLKHFGPNCVDETCDFLEVIPLEYNNSTDLASLVSNISSQGISVILADVHQTDLLSLMQAASASQLLQAEVQWIFTAAAVPDCVIDMTLLPLLDGALLLSEMLPRSPALESFSLIQSGFHENSSIASQLAASYPDFFSGHDGSSQLLNNDYEGVHLPLMDRLALVYDAVWAGMVAFAAQNNSSLSARVKELDFTGVTGRLQFDDACTRSVPLDVLVYNLQNSSWIPVANYVSSAQVTSQLSTPVWRQNSFIIQDGRTARVPCPIGYPLENSKCLAPVCLLLSLRNPVNDIISLSGVLAINHVNTGNYSFVSSSHQLDPHFGIKMNLIVYGTSPETLLSSALSQCQNSIIIGCGRSTEAEPLASASFYLKIPIISHWASATKLKDFPAFFRTVPADSNIAAAVINLANKFGWQELAILYVGDEWGSGMAQDVELRGSSSSSPVKCLTVSFSSIDSIDASLERVKSYGIRVIVGLLSDKPNETLVRAQAHGMTGNGYTWIFTEIVDLLYLSTEQTRTILPGSFVLRPYVPSSSIDRLAEAVLTNETLALAPREQFDLDDMRGATVEQAATWLYDAVWAAAFALNSNFSTSASETFPPFETITNALHHDVTFNGTSGSVSFDATSGDRADSTVVIGIYNLQRDPVTSADSATNALNRMIRLVGSVSDGQVMFDEPYVFYDGTSNIPPIREPGPLPVVPRSSSWIIVVVVIGMLVCGACLAVCLAKCVKRGANEKIMHLLQPLMSEMWVSTLQTAVEIADMVSDLWAYIYVLMTLENSVGVVILYSIFMVTAFGASFLAFLTKYKLMRHVWRESRGSEGKGTLATTGRFNLAELHASLQRASSLSQVDETQSESQILESLTANQRALHRSYQKQAANTLLFVFEDAPMTFLNIYIVVSRGFDNVSFIIFLSCAVSIFLMGFKVQSFTKAYELWTQRQAVEIQIQRTLVLREQQGGHAKVVFSVVDEA